MYEEINEFIEKWSKHVFVIFEKTIVTILIMPTALKCYFMYFTTDSGAEAFELPMPMW